MVRKVRNKLFPFAQGHPGVLDGVKKHPHTLFLQVVVWNLEEHLCDAGLEAALAWNLSLRSCKSRVWWSTLQRVFLSPARHFRAQIYSWVSMKKDTRMDPNGHRSGGTSGVSLVGFLFWPRPLRSFYRSVRLKKNRSGVKIFEIERFWTERNKLER